MQEKLVLIVDDKFSVTRMISEYLESKGFKILVANNGVQALTEARIHHPDLILLDIMMPHMDGYEFIKIFRSESSTPIILITAKIEETDKVIGLELGADDYITKPFSLAELVARIHAVLRRTELTLNPNQIIEVQGLLVFPDRYEVRKDGKIIELTPTEFELLLALAEQPGRVFTREQLLKEIQGEAYESLEKTINVHIRNLRVKIEDNPSDPFFIQTVFGVGYRFYNGSA
ncbi:MAG: response regulator [Anaerolineales bacterium]